MNWFVRDFSTKVGLLIVAAILSLLAGVALISVAGTSVAAVFTAAYLLAVAFFAARRFRGPSEPAARPWWQMTAGIGWSAAWAVLFLADAANGLVGIVATSTASPGSIAALLVQTLLAGAFVTSAVRLGGHPPRPASEPSA